MTNQPQDQAIDESFYTVPGFHDATAYQTSMKMPAPDYIDTDPPQSWFDPTTASLPDDQLITYNRLNVANGKAFIDTYQVPVRQARKVNFPGPIVRPPWVVAKTDANLNPALLATLDQAKMVATLFKRPEGAIQEANLAFFPIDYKTETRRYYLIAMEDGSLICVGTFLGQMYANGMGTPGTVDLSDQSNPRWVPIKVDSHAPTLAPNPRPCRALMANEELIAGMFDSVVIRTNPPVVESYSVVLRRIDANIQLLLKK
jgi:hypothetical protein